MTSLKLTEQQKKYLLCLEDLKGRSTISDFSKYFNCSRTNSKKILDRMLKAGLFYKEDNKYMLTEVGKSLSSEIYRERNAVKDFISMSLFVDEKESRVYSFSLMASESEFSDFIVQKASKLSKIPLEKKLWKYTELEELLGEGTYPISFVIYKREGGEDEANIGLSMANRGYEDRAYLEIGENSYVVFKSKILESTHRGYLKKGIIQELFYQEKGKEKKVSSVDSLVKVPLSVFTQWQGFGNGIFCSNSVMKSKVSIGFINHSKSSNYLVILNLLEI